MAEKWSVKDKEGKEVWSGMAMTATEAVSCACLAHKGIDREDLSAVVVPFGVVFIDTPQTIDESAGQDKKRRKPRADKGQPKDKGKKKRNRGEYFVFYTRADAVGVVTEGLSRAAAEEVLDSVLVGTPRLFRGHELKFTRKVQFTLKPV